MPRNYEKFAWPGGYENFAIMDDGEALCVDCLNDDSNPVHTEGEADGWRIEGFTNTSNEDSDFLVCSHCGRTIGQ